MRNFSRLYCWRLEDVDRQARCEFAIERCSASPDIGEPAPGTLSTAPRISSETTRVGYLEALRWRPATMASRWPLVMRTPLAADTFVAADRVAVDTFLVVNRPDAELRETNFPLLAIVGLIVRIFRELEDVNQDSSNEHGQIDLVGEPVLCPDRRVRVAASPASRI